MSTGYQYQPTDLNDELFLSEVPIDLLEKSIETQFQEPLEYRKKDYVQSFITKYNFSKENEHEDDQLLVDQYHDDFLVFMENKFYTYLNLGFPDIDTMDEEDKHDLIHLTYRFFIKNIKKNFVTMVCNYINNDSKNIIENLEKKKDVTSLTFKSEIDNETDILILSNLELVIKDFLNDVYNTYDVDKFMSMCIGDEVCLETEFVKTSFDNFEITGNFIQSYVEMVDENFRFEIQSKIRNHILKKYPKRVRKDEVVEDEKEVTTNTDEVNEPEETLEN